MHFRSYFMIHKTIQLKNISLSLPHKLLFENFTTTIQHGSRIAIIGRNGSGKSTLLQFMQRGNTLCLGEMAIPDDVKMGYVPQVINEFHDSSGAERINKSLTRALTTSPNVLLLDEPTNYLDKHNRKSLQRMLDRFTGTLIMATHDVELLRSTVDTLWHIENGRVSIFHGRYNDYIRETSIQKVKLEKQLSSLKQEKKNAHTALMKEQSRAASSRAKGKKSIKQKKWPTIVSDAKARRAEMTTGQKKSTIESKKQKILEQLNNLNIPEIIVPTFNLNGEKSSVNFLSINSGAVGYENETIVRNINLTIDSNNRVAICGNNRSGKTTVIKAILDDPNIKKFGDWQRSNISDIGYLDQHYQTLDPTKTVFEAIANLVPSWNHQSIRRHLVDFLFRTNEEVNAQIHQLSGGEKARLCLAQIAAKTPKLLILDEVTNNLDLETRTHVIQVLNSFPGAMIVISHDQLFLESIRISEYYNIKDGLFD